jgi:hypothetical protein
LECVGDCGCGCIIDNDDDEVGDIAMSASICRSSFLASAIFSSIFFHSRFLESMVFADHDSIAMFDDSSQNGHHFLHSDIHTRYNFQ